MTTYALKTETKDGTVHTPFSTLTNKAAAIRFAKLIAKTNGDPDATRIWVDNMETDCGIANFGNYMLDSRKCVG